MTVVAFDSFPLVSAALGLLLGSAAALVVGSFRRRPERHAEPPILGACEDDEPRLSEAA
jgi:hypothetical protein